MSSGGAWKGRKDGERRGEEKRPGIEVEVKVEENKQGWRRLAALHARLQFQLVTLFIESNCGSSSSCETWRVSLRLLWSEVGISSKHPGPRPFQRMTSLCFGLMARCSSACSDHSLPLPSPILPSQGSPSLPPGNWWPASKVVWSPLRSGLF